MKIDYEDYFMKLKEWMEGKLDRNRYHVVLADSGKLLGIADTLEKRSKAVIYVTGGMVRCQGHDYFVGLFRQFVKEVYHATERG